MTSCDLAPGKVRVKAGGSDAGHNGLRSISASLGPDYRRVRIGIRTSWCACGFLSYVLHDFLKVDKDWLVPLLDAIAGGCAAAGLR